MELKEEEFEKFFSKFTEKLVNISDYWSEIEKFLSEYFNYCFDAVQRFLSWLKDLLIGNKELFKTSAEGFMSGAIRNAIRYSAQFFRTSPAGRAGEVLKRLNQITPILVGVLIAFEAYDIGTENKKDFENKSRRNMVTKVLIKILTSMAGLGGAAGGAAIGTFFFPGIGTMIGNLFGGMIGPPVVAVASNAEAWVNNLFDWMELGIDSIRCEQCFRTFENRRYEEGRQKLCRCCRH